MQQVTDEQLARQVSIFEWSASTEARFWVFHRDHPEVFAELVRRAREMRDRGLRFGIRALWEAMRWDFAVRPDGREPFKLNDHYTSRYARMVMEEPGLEGVFETREIRG